ncbi:aquaporin [Mycoplasma sp. Ms02]|uniref:aquaporin n=1 Tax=Mycoplasma sp. Ms02 TaxID=353851 RepID=UPI001C8AEC53|nr:aquaporin [Mycoplasma sp. Ms02]QZE12610.1 aquaporin [Mycoplasma sp. Ms02]
MDSMQNTEKLSVFKYFGLTKAKRVNAEQPKDKKTWFIHAISEIIGTVFISLGLAGLSTHVTEYSVIEHYLTFKWFVGFFAGFIIVGICLFTFLRWSCDLNPAVTLTRLLKGTNTLPYALMKWTMQIIGAFIAALIIYAVGRNAGAHTANHAIETTKVVNASVFNQILTVDGYNGHHHLAGFIYIFVIEAIMVACLLFPIFSPRIDNKYRDLMIMFIISLVVWMGVLSGTAAINPARGLAQQLPTLLFYPNYEQYKDVALGTVAMVLGGLFGSVFYIWVQGFTEKYVNPLVVKIIEYKNNRPSNMTKPNQK